MLMLVPMIPASPPRFPDTAQGLIQERRPQAITPMFRHNMEQPPGWRGLWIEFRALSRLGREHPWLVYARSLYASILQLQTVAESLTRTVASRHGEIVLEKGASIELVTDVFTFHPRPFDDESMSSPRLVGLFCESYQSEALVRDFKVGGGCDLLPSESGVGLDAFSGEVGWMGASSLAWQPAWSPVIGSPSQIPEAPPEPTLHLRDRPVLRWPNRATVSVLALESSRFRLYAVLDMGQVFGQSPVREA